jgi:hypothetical protein
MASATDGQRLYMFGGRDYSGGGVPSVTRDTIYEYDPSADRMTQRGARLPHAVESAGAAWYRDRFYIVGGYSDEIQLYDPVADQVTTAATRLPYPMWGAAVANFGDALLIFGGWHFTEYGGVGTAAVFRYRPASGILDQLPDLPTWRTDNVAVVEEDRVLLFGGDGQDTVLVYYPSNGLAYYRAAKINIGWQGRGVWTNSGILLTNGKDIFRYETFRDIVWTMNATLREYRAGAGVAWIGNAMHVAGGGPPTVERYSLGGTFDLSWDGDGDGIPDAVESRLCDSPAAAVVNAPVPGTGGRWDAAGSCSPSTPTTPADYRAYRSLDEDVATSRANLENSVQNVLGLSQKAIMTGLEQARATSIGARHNVTVGSQARLSVGTRACVSPQPDCTLVDADKIHAYANDVGAWAGGITGAAATGNLLPLLQSPDTMPPPGSLAGPDGAVQTYLVVSNPPATPGCVAHRAENAPPLTTLALCTPFGIPA